MTLRKPALGHDFARDRRKNHVHAGRVTDKVSGVNVMSEDQKAREEAQPMPKEAPAANGPENTKDQQEPQHSFHDWASI